MLVNKRVNTFDTYDGLFNYLWDSNNNNPFDRTATQHSLGILLGSNAAQKMKRRRRWIGFPQIEFLVSNFPSHGMVIEFRAESRELVNLKKTA